MTRVQAVSSSGQSRSIAALLVAAAAVVMLHDTAAASDHKPPRVVLRLASTVQQGLLRSYCWSTGSLIGLSTNCSHASWRFPPKRNGKAIPVLHFYKMVPPDKLTLWTWAKLTRGGEPAGKRRTIGYRLVPSLSGAGLTWQAELGRNIGRAGPVFLSAVGVWREEEGCCHEQQAIWNFAFQRE